MHLQSKLLAVSLLIVLVSISGIQTRAFSTLDGETCFRLPCPELVVITDKHVYLLGEDVKISGQVSNEIFKSGEQVVIQVLSPVEELIRVEVSPASDGTFVYELPLDGDIISIPSSYDVFASYDQHGESATFSYMLEGMVDYDCGFSRGCEYHLTFNDTSYQVDYKLNGIIQSITLNPERNSLVIDALVYSDASFLELSLDPQLIRATELDESGKEMHLNFSVLVNGKNAEKVSSTAPEPTTPTTDRRVFISKLEEGQNTVEIMGTRAIPEFGALALVIMAGTVAGIVVWTRSTVRKMDYV